MFLERHSCLPRCFFAATDACCCWCCCHFGTCPLRGIIFGSPNALFGTTEDLGDLDRVTRIVKLVGFVNCTDGFSGQPKVVNGASDLFAEVS